MDADHVEGQRGIDPQKPPAQQYHARREQDRQPHRHPQQIGVAGQRRQARARRQQHQQQHRGAIGGKAGKQRAVLDVGEAGPVAEAEMPVGPAVEQGLARIIEDRLVIDPFAQQYRQRGPAGSPESVEDERLRYRQCQVEHQSQQIEPWRGGQGGQHRRPADPPHLPEQDAQHRHGEQQSGPDPQCRVVSGQAIRHRSSG